MAGNGANLGDVLSHYPVVLFQVERDGVVTVVEGGAAPALAIVNESKAAHKPLWEEAREAGWLADGIRRALEGANITCQGHIGEHAFDMVLQPNLDKSGRVIGALGFGYDITDRVRAEKERDQLISEKYRYAARLIRSLELENEVFSAARIGVFILDRQFRYKFCNRCMLELLETTADQCLGRKVWEQRADLARESVEPLFMRVLAGEVVQGPLRQFGRTTGDVTWVYGTYGPLCDSEGKVIGIIVLIRNVTEQLKAETKLRQAEESFHGLIEALPEVVGVAVNGVVVYVNRSAFTRLGYQSREELIGRSVLDMFYGGENRTIAAQRLMLAAASGSTEPVEQRLMTKTGEVFPAEVSSSKVIFDGRPALLGVARDLSERKKMQTQLIASERLASMGALAAGVGHEINNPLASVMANLDLVTSRLTQLAATGLLPETVGELIEPLADARQAATQIRDIARDLRLFSRGTDDEYLTPIDLKRVLDSTLRMARNEIKHRARLVKDYEPAPAVCANESRLAQVFLNLVVNAAQAMPEGHAESNEIRIATRTRGDRAVVEVSDTGKGMSQEVIDHLFSPFFTTKSGDTGVGLGLVICQRIITAIGGTIEVESSPGKGSLFRVVLPGVADVARLPTPRPSPVPEPTRSGRVLVIDDEPAIGRVINRILSPQHRVTVFNDAREALEKLRSGESYDLVLCDLMMPRMTGMEFFNELSASSPDILSKVIFLTAGAFTPGARAFLESVSNRRLDKPFDAQTLRSTVNSFLR